jgi:hypothetical protein
LGSYNGRPPGINADRLDWLIRDAHHANLVAKLPPKMASKYNEFFKRNKNNNFGIEVVDREYLHIDDITFNNLMKDLRENIYSTIYEGIERSFTDSLLIRLAYSTISVINTVGNDIASAPITTRAIMGYLLMYDFLMKQYTTRTLHLARQHIKLLGITDPITTFIAKSDDLNLVADIKCIMHYLSTTTPKEISLPSMDLNLEYIELRQIDRNLIIFTAEAFGNLIEKAQKASKATEACKLAVL